MEPVTIGEVERLTGVSAKTLRYYHQIGLLEPAASTEAGYRLYGAAEMWRLNLIRSLREMDFSLAAIRTLLSGEQRTEAAIALQLEAVEVELARLERIRTVLQRAQNEGDAALERLETLGAALGASAGERQRFLAEALRDTLAAEAPPAWREAFVEGFIEDLPEQLDGDRLDAWLELLELLRDDDMARTLSAQVRPFWTATRARGVAPESWVAGMSEVMQGALAAHRAGAPPESEAVQDAVARWVALFAAAEGVPADAGYYARFATMAERMLPEEGVRVQKLLARIRGEGEEGVAAQRLLLEGVRWRVERGRNRTE